MDEMEEKEKKIDSSPTSSPGEDDDAPFLCLFDMLLKWAEVQPNKDLWSFVDHNGVQVESLSYFLAAQNIEILANELINPARGPPNLKCGDRVLLVYPAGLSFIVAFMACLRARLIAVPVYPPNLQKAKNSVVAFSRIAANCGAKVVLTSSDYGHVRKISDIERLHDGKVRFPKLQWMITDSILRKRLSSHSRTGLEQLRTVGKCVMGDEPAFVQYTSGSTSSPKGVIVTHGNLYHNLNLVVHELSAKSDTIVCSWLPQYHDMGLIGCYLGVLRCGGKGYYMSPQSFVRHPAIWIWAINYYRATHLQSPSFGYTLSAKSWKTTPMKSKLFPSKAKLDLSCVRYMVNGAEPIDYRSIDAFYETFCPHGLKRGVVFPAYGLAEHTLFVCGNGCFRVHVKQKDLIHKRVTVVKEEMEGVSDGGGSIAEEPDHDLDLTNTEEEETKETEDDCKLVVRVGCGKPCKKFNVDIQIVDPSSFQRLGTDRVGEVWVKSDSKALGYLGTTVGESFEMFCAHIREDNQEVKLEMGGSVLNAEPDVHGCSVPLSTALRRNNGMHTMREGYLRTGDEGFFHGGELFICGRIKDMIIIFGKNFYPQDIERSVEIELYDSLRPGCSAAFGISSKDNEGEEKLVLVCEARQHFQKPGSENQLRALAKDICFVVRHQYGIQVSVVVLVPTHGNYKTTSGKIARQWSNKAFIDGELDILYQWNAENDELDDAGQHDIPLEDTVVKQSLNRADSSREELDISNMGFDELQASLIQAVSRLLGSSANVYTTTPLYQMGLDSITMGQLSGLLSQYGLNLSVEDLFGENMTIEHITNLVKPTDIHTPGDPSEADKQDFRRVSKCESCAVNHCPCCLYLLMPPCCLIGKSVHVKI